MNILWNPNPLCSVIELDVSDKRWLRERLKVEDLLERIGEAHFDLDPVNQKWSNENIKREPYPLTSEGFANRAKGALDYEYLLGEKDYEGRKYEEYIDQRLVWAFEAIAGPHSGDCTCNPCSCVKCQTEEILGTHTIAGLGKHEASKIDGQFSSGATLDEAIENLRNYKPTATKEWMEPHLARWTEEGRRAFEWLSKYKTEHF